MFGFKTIVVGDITSDQLGAAFLKADELDERDLIDATTVVRVYQWAWDGEWLATAQQLQRSGEYDAQTVISGSDDPDEFFLHVGEMLMHRTDEPVTADDCVWWAAGSLININNDAFEAVYGVVLTSAAYAQEHTHHMLHMLSEIQHDTDYGVAFKIRIFIINDDGTVEMHKDM